jgi:transposase
VSSLPQSVRQAIVRIHDQGFTYAETASMLDVGEATVSRILRLRRETGGIEPRPRGGGNTSPIRRVERLLSAILRDMPDATVVELTQMLMSRSRVRTSRSSVQRALARLGYSRKKNGSRRRSATLQSTERDTASSARS